MDCNQVRTGGPAAFNPAQLKLLADTDWNNGELAPPVYGEQLGSFPATGRLGLLTVR